MKMIKRIMYFAGALIALHGTQTLADSHTIQVQAHIQGTSFPDLGKIALTSKQNAASFFTFPAPIRAMPLEQVRDFQARSMRATPQTQFSATTVAPPVAGCYDVNLGSAYNAPTAQSGFTDCFEFVAPDATKLDGYVVNLPSNEEHDVHLVQVNSDGTWTYLDNEIDTSPNKIVEAIPGGPVRILLLVDSQQGAGGATFEFQVLGTTGYDSYEPNDSILHPSQINGNQSLSANLDSSSDYDYYQFNQPSGQTTLGVSLTGTSDQTLEVETAPGTWQTLAQNTYWTLTTSAGGSVMFRVYQISPAVPVAKAKTGTVAATAEPYTLNFSDGNNVGSVYSVSDNENLTHLVGFNDVAHTVSLGVKVYDSTGNVVQPGGIPVEVLAYDSNTQGDFLVGQASGVTDPISGTYSTQLSISGCTGAISTGEFSTPTYPPVYWIISYTKGYFEALTASTVNSNNPGKDTFYHICSETLRGSQP